MNSSVGVSVLIPKQWTKFSLKMYFFDLLTTSPPLLSERLYREQIVIFREIIFSRRGNKSKIQVTQASFSLYWVILCTKKVKPFFVIEFKVL